MNKTLRFIIGVLVIIAMSFASTRSIKVYQVKRELRKRRPPRTIQYEKPMVVLVPSYNNSKYCRRNLRSIFDQNYTNFRVIYIDDASQDDTYEKVLAFLSTARKEISVDLIRNKTNQGALANLYNAIHSCKDDEIIVTVDGDDHLAHEGVLAKLNRIYENKDVRMTYGNFLNYPTFTQTPVTCKQIAPQVILDNTFRHAEWVSSHLRTFYAGLFKKIKLQDFLFEGKFLPMGWDLAFMIPMLEMSGKHAQFVKDVLYLYNRENPLSDHVKNLKLQSACHAHIAKLPKYAPLHSLKLQPLKPLGVDLIIFSYDRPMQLYALLESLEKHAFHLTSTHILFRTSDGTYLSAYQKVFHRFPHVIPHHEGVGDFKPLFLQATFDSGSPADFVAFAVDDIIITQDIDFLHAATALCQTQAYGLYLSNGTNLNHCYMLNQEMPLPTHVTLREGLHAWQFKQGTSDWRYPHTLDLGLYKKSAIKKHLRTLTYHNPPTLESAWAQKSKRNRIGLFYHTSKSVNIPLNIVSPSSNRHAKLYTPSELLTLFNQGLKINIAPLHQISNPSRHIEYSPEFIPFQ